ncbi:MAG: efflux RND transporter periplasmic adaptor subunit [Ardenticatenaceae bacterium]|nr:efflux RND transporter periplasmic adaptor subunit [Ardenticatenaceae bacterium]
MLRKKSFWLVLLLVVGVAAAGVFYVNAQQQTAQATEEPAVQTATVRRGEIVVSASGAGTIIPAADVAIGFQSGGVLQALLVAVGDEVAAGDVLARLDSTNAQQAVEQAELQVEQAAVQVTGESVERSIALAQINVEQAQINLTSAQSALDDLLTWQADEETIAVAQANLAAAAANLQEAQNRDAVAGSSLTSARVSVDQAERALAEAQEAYDTAWDPGRDWELGDPRRVDQLESERERTADSLLRAQESLQVAQANYAVSAGSLSNSNGLSAETAVLNAQIALETAQTGPTDEEITAAQIQVQQAELALRQAELNLESAQDQTQAELSLTQAQLNLAAAEEALAATELSAPVSGTVLAIEASVGENVGTATFITLADLAQPLLEVYLDETDMAMVAVGFAVDVIFDALPDDTFVGQVVQVDPQLTVQNGVTAVRALVQLDDFSKPQTLPVGMNATVEVIGGRTSNALLVPVEALREISPENFAVFVMGDGEPKLTFVEVGLMDFTYAEIISGVNQGDVVTTGILETGN